MRVPGDHPPVDLAEGRCVLNHPTCEDHGHYCPICEQDRYERERKQAIEKLVKSWNWNATPREVADDIEAVTGLERRQSYRFDFDAGPKEMLGALYEEYGEKLTYCVLDASSELRFVNWQPPKTTTTNEGGAP